MKIQGFLRKTPSFPCEEYDSRPLKNLVLLRKISLGASENAVVLHKPGVFQRSRLDF